MIGFIDTLYTQLRTTGNYSAITIPTLYRSLLHTLESSVFTSRILATDSVTAAHCEVFFARPNSFLAIILASPSTADSLNSLLQLPTPELDWILILAAWDPRYIASGRTHRKHCFLYCCILIHCCTDVFTAPLRSNARCADYRKHRSSIVARVRFCGNVFTESLPSSEQFRLSGIMSQYFLQSLQTNVRMLPQIRPRMLSFMSFPIHYPPITSPFDDKQPQVLAAPLNKP
jgi:hypothetical protein